MPDAPPMNIRELLSKRIEGSIAAVTSLRGEIDQIASLADVIATKLQAGGTVYTCGNGGSAAQALHLAEELIGRYRSNRAPLRAVCLNADPTALTCIANDFGFEHVFSRQCEALLTDRDVLAVFSTSGNSDNVVNALKVAKSKKSTAVGLLGKSGGKCLPLCDHCVVVTAAGDDSAFIQEAHEVILHLICETLDH
jgi:D-sedoheptulose 7-phosphate isomerase